MGFKTEDKFEEIELPSVNFFEKRSVVFRNTSISPTVCQSSSPQASNDVRWQIS